MSANPGFAGIIPYRQVIGLQAGGKNITIDTGDLAGGSMTFRHATSEAGVFSVGGAVIGGVDFTLLNDSGKFSDLDWKGATVTIVYQMTTSANSFVNMGVYNVVHHKDSGQTIQIEAQDNMSLLDNYEIYELYNAYGLEWPADSSSVVSMIARFNGLTATGAKGGLILEDPGDDHMTQRACLSYIAECMGQFARINRATTAAIGTRIAFGWYDFGDVYDAGAAFSHNLEANDVTIGAVEVTDWEGETTVKRGSGEYCIRIGGNPFISANNIEAVADNIAEAVIGMTFRPGDVSILSNPSIREGDVIRVAIGVEQKPVTVIASNITYKSQTLTESITSDAETYDDLRINQSAYVKKEAKKEAEKNARKEADILISDYLADPSSKLSTAITGGARSAIGDELNNPKSDLSGAILGGARDTIRSELEDPDSDLSIAIEDAGGGLDPEALKKELSDNYGISAEQSGTGAPKLHFAGDVDVTGGMTVDGKTLEQQIDETYATTGKDSATKGHKDVTVGKQNGSVLADVQIFGSLWVNGKEITGDGGGGGPGNIVRSIADLYNGAGLTAVSSPISSGQLSNALEDWQWQFPDMDYQEYYDKMRSVCDSTRCEMSQSEYWFINDYFKDQPETETVEFEYDGETRRWQRRIAWSDFYGDGHAPIMYLQWFDKNDTDRTKWTMKCGCYLYHIFLVPGFSGGTWPEFASAWMESGEDIPIANITIPDSWYFEPGNPWTNVATNGSVSPAFPTEAMAMFPDISGTALNNWIHYGFGEEVRLPYRDEYTHGNVHYYHIYVAAMCSREDLSMPDDTMDLARVWMFEDESHTPFIDETIGNWSATVKNTVFKK